VIRPFLEYDMDSVINIWLEASIISHNFIEKEFWMFKIDDMKEKYIPNSETYVYERNNMILGFFSLFENRLAAIFVSPEFQNQGIGKEMISQAKLLRKKLDLTVYKKNIKSVLFYENVGFERVGESIDKITNQMEIKMEWRCID
jgi:putative acetyltransferase